MSVQPRLQEESRVSDRGADAAGVPQHHSVEHQAQGAVLPGLPLAPPRWLPRSGPPVFRRPRAAALLLPLCLLSACQRTSKVVKPP
jgi:hypothetical protein